MWFYDMLEEEPLRVVEDSRRIGKVLGVFNSTLLSLIPNKDIPTSFHDFGPISLWNCIYDMIAKIIVVGVKKIFYETISKEQFGFLHERKIHKATRVAYEGL
jgi:hypothetical protein